METTLEVRNATSFNGIDLVKFICAFLVCAIHIDPLTGSAAQYSYLLRLGLCRIAVPFFFVASGFFLFRKMDPARFDRARLKKYCFKLLLLFGLWQVLLVFGERYQLWYLGAAAFAALFVGLLLMWRVKFRYIAVLAVALYMIGILGDTYYGLLAPVKALPVLRYGVIAFEKVFFPTRNGLFMGVIFVFMGAVFAWKPIRIPRWLAVTGTVFSLALLVGECFVLHKLELPWDYNLYLSLIPATFFLFGFAKDLKLKDRAIYKRLRGIGALVFYLHLIVYHFVEMGTSVANRVIPIDLSVFDFVITVAATLTLAVLIEALSHRKGFHWLRYIYG